MNEGHFPKSVQLGERAIALVDTEIESQAQEKIDSRDEKEQQVTVNEVKLLKEAEVIAWLKDKFKQSNLSEEMNG